MNNNGGIRFPKVHIAASVTNRILNVADEIERKRELRQQRPAVPSPTPNVPNPAFGGTVLDQSLAKPTPDLPPPNDGPNGPAVNTLEAVLSGGKPIQGILDGLSTG